MAKKNNPILDIELTPDEPLRNGFNWYPGHMARAIREIKEKMRLVDIVFEVRDARAPLASGNKNLDETLRQKSRIIILNKSNLADPEKMKLWEKWFQNNSEPFMFIDCFDKSMNKKLLNLARVIVNEKRKASNPDTYEYKEKIKIMIIGLPNTGKSTLINQLANRAAVKVANLPGQTRVQQWIVIDQNLELLDTPGVMPPVIIKEEHGLWLSALHAIPDDIAGEERPARFLVDYFIRLNSTSFMERYKLAHLDMTVEEALEKIATLRGCVKQKGLIDFDRVYKLILNDFRKGDLGKCCFGLPPVK